MVKHRKHPNMPLGARGGGGGLGGEGGGVVIYLSTKHVGVFKNSFKRVCAFQNELKFGSVGA